MDAEYCWKCHGLGHLGECIVDPQTQVDSLTVENSHLQLELNILRARLCEVQDRLIKALEPKAIAIDGSKIATALLEASNRGHIVVPLNAIDESASRSIQAQTQSPFANFGFQHAWTCPKCGFIVQTWDGATYHDRQCDQRMSDLPPAPEVCKHCGQTREFHDKAGLCGLLDPLSVSE